MIYVVDFRLLKTLGHSHNTICTVGDDVIKFRKGVRLWDRPLKFASLVT